MHWNPLIKLIWRMKKTAFSIVSVLSDVLNNTKPFLISQTNRTQSFTEATPTLIFVTRCTLKRKKDPFLRQNHPEKQSGRIAFGQRFPPHSRPFGSNFITMVGWVCFPFSHTLGIFFASFPGLLPRCRVHDIRNILVFPKVCPVPCFFNVRSTILRQGGLHF